jgi:hypothetical protein
MQSAGYNINPKQSLGAQSISGGTTVSGTAVDTQGAAEVVISVNLGTFTATGTADVTVTECATSGGTYTAITGATFAQFTTSNDADTYKGRIKIGAGRLRYMKIKVVQATAAILIAGDIILARTQQKPVGTLVFNV